MRAASIAEFDIFAGEGGMRALMRAHDWSTSPLGHPSTWPQALRTVLNLMLDSKFPMFVAWGPELGFLYNDAYVEILGAKHPAAIGRRLDLVWAEIWRDVSPLIDRALSGCAIYREDLPLLMTRKGHEEHTWFTFSYSPARDDDGKIAGVFCACTETTPKIHAEKRQAFQLELTDRMRGLAASADITATACKLLGLHIGVARVGYAEFDEATNTVNVGQGWTDGTVQSVMGQAISLDRFGEPAVAEIRAGNTLRINDVAADERCAGYVESYLALGMRAVMVIPSVKSDNLTSILVIGAKTPRRWSDEEVRLSEDVMERIWDAVQRARAEASLRIERDRSQGILDSMAEGFILLGHDFRILQINAEGLRLEGRPASEIIGKTPWEAWPGLENLEVGRAYKRAMAQRIPQSVDQSYTYPDGRTIWLEVRAMPVNEGLAIIYHDVTARKNIEDELRRADRRKDEFLAMLAHELRNPLAPISAAAQLLKLQHADEPDIQKPSSIIVRQVEHMTSLVNDLLDVSRVTRGLVTLTMESLDLGEIVAVAVEQVRPLMEAKRHRLTVRAADGPAAIEGDRARLIQVIANLLNNAGKYTPAGGEIVLTTMVKPERIEVSVRDNGIGIAPPLLPHVFDLFAQGERSPDRSQGGLGLGLALVKSLVELHGGCVSAHSDGAGRGSEFAFQLPRLLGRAADDEQAAAGGAAAAANSRPLCVLVVDDNADAALSLSLLLEADGHCVRVAHDTRSALETASDGAPQVCLLDIGLPDVSGYELARRLQSQPHTAHAVLIALTGYGQPQDREQSIAAGFDHHLVKPADPARLRALLSELAARVTRGAARRD